MSQPASVPDDLTADQNQNFNVTIDLAVLAQVNRGDKIEIDFQADRTLELFERTIHVVDEQNVENRLETSNDSDKGIGLDPNRFIPEHGDLRKRFFFAETLGSYSTLHDLLDQFSPAYRMSQTFNGEVNQGPLNRTQIAELEDYQTQIHGALLHAHNYLLENINAGYTAEELQELNGILTEAKERFEIVTEILGVQLIHDIESAVRQLFTFQGKMRAVQKSIDGIFMIDSEVMFIPTNDLVKIVNDLFKAVGNPYVAENIDGMLLLAARNLLIEAVAFHSYYGKEQIYRVFRRGQSTRSRSAITHQIRGEIRQLFKACTLNNRLVLRRLMSDAERKFEISVEAIQTAAEENAIAVVNTLIPAIAPPPRPSIRPSLLKRVHTWLFR